MTQSGADLTSVESQTRRWDPRINGALFLATVVTVFYAGYYMMLGSGELTEAESHWYSGWPFAVPFLLILLFHEFGHWLAARAHRVPASLPYFLPIPHVISMFGSMGAIIVMPERIRSRNALLDIGAAGPLAGMVVAVPAMVIGLELSEVRSNPAGGSYHQEGQSLLYWLIKRAVVGPIPPGQDVWLHPTAFAAWGGFLITMINMLPWGQLDGGHIAYALFGEQHHQAARWIRYSLLLLFLYNVAIFVLPVATGESQTSYAEAIGNSAFWLAWFFMTGVMGRFFGAEHPPVEPGKLTRGRKLVAWGTLAMFVLLFMPTPLSHHTVSQHTASQHTAVSQPTPVPHLTPRKGPFR